MKVKKVSGFFLHYGKMRNRPGIIGWISDNSSRIGKTPYFNFKCVNGNKTDLLIAMGQELRYLELTEVDPKTPFEGKTVEIEV